MVEYWSCRRKQALLNSRYAATTEAREMFIRVAEHCRALENWRLPSTLSATPNSGASGTQRESLPESVES